MKCIHCGCTDEKACEVRVIDQPIWIRRAIAHKYAPNPPTKIGCSWISKDPPVCSAPACMTKQEKSLTQAPDAP